MNIFFLHSLQKQNVGFHCFIAFLNFPRLSNCFISLGTSAHIFGLRNSRLSVPLKLNEPKEFETEVFALIHKVFALSIEITHLKFRDLNL